ncbi:MAG: protein kinase [Planctomycetaceae bacterium]
MTFHFRCPNCDHKIEVLQQKDFVLQGEEEIIECPSCHSRVSLSNESESTIVLPEGRRVAHFRIIRLLGEGAFGAVYLAFDEELQRNVALKVPRPDRVNPRSEVEFLREARAAAACEHPNLVRVHEAGKFEDGYYIAMEYIDGISLSQYLKTHELSATDAVRLMIPLLRACQVFHDRGMVHRDLKPANILLDGQRQPHITDFGLAKVVQSHDISVTHSGNIVGTLYYMSAEQARADANIDCRTDVYSMGVILYQMLTGRRPFNASSLHTLLYSLQHDDPSSPRKHNSKVPRDLETIVLKAIRKERERRFESAGQMADSLQLFLDGKPIPDKPVSLAERTIKWASRNRAIAASSLVTTLTLLFAAVAIFLTPPPPPPPPVAPSDHVPVIIETTPPATEIRFVRYDDTLRVPHGSGFTATTTSGEPVHLQPGVYKVFARDANGRYHEVWRTVPEKNSGTPLEQRFPHTFYSRDDVDNIMLPAFKLFTDSELWTAFGHDLVRIDGGTLRMGDPQGGDLVQQRTREVASFLVARDEVSVGQFRSVLNKPIPWFDGKLTWLETFDRQFEITAPPPANQPMSGCPIDWAILFSELTGVRLPANYEFEYLAIQRTGAYSGDTGQSIRDAANWGIVAVGQPTPDEWSEHGIRNLLYSVAEYTDSVNVHYKIIYPESYGIMPKDRAELDHVLEANAPREARGAPPGWAYQDESQPDTVTARTRLSIPAGPQLDSELKTTLSRFGWRVYRSVPE